MRYSLWFQSYVVRTRSFVCSFHPFLSLQIIHFGVIDTLLRRRYEPIQDCPTEC